MGLPVSPIEAAAAFGAGFLLQPDPTAGGAVQQVQAQLNKLPAIGNRAISTGILLYYGNKAIVKNRYVAMLAKAVLFGGIFEFGRKKGVTSQALLGDDSDWETAMDADAISGVLDDDDDVGDDDDDVGADDDDDDE
jgi:hypothetical protein